ncbi:MAG TPA: ATP cone domain-containing protein [Xanthomonadales bacterium]|nr:ATP cone domain-containing protein [Xanthomonadales bacterium]
MEPSISVDFKKMKHIVKRKGHTESFDARKIYASVFASCLVLRMKDEEAELIAHMVSDEVEKALKDVKQIEAHKIHKLVTQSLKKYNADASYIYDTHRDIS